MANVLVDPLSLTAIADAIRSKLGVQTTYKPAEMADAIDSISAGITPTGTKSITANGTYDVTEFASAEVAVPASTPTGTKQISITENGTTTEDVTNYASAEITVNVPTGGGGGGLELIDTIQVSGRSVQINIDSDWLDEYISVVIVPDLDISASDWIYMKVDGTTGGDYTEKVAEFGDTYSMILSGSSSVIRVAWWKNSSTMINQVVTGYLYVYAYASSSTMSGTIKIYGVKG